MSNEIKSQHYVPRFVLRFFGDRENVNKAWELNLHTNRICLKSIEKLCAQNNLYEIRDEEGNFIFPNGRNKLEKGLAKIESDYSVYFNELFLEIPRMNTHFILKEGLRESLCTWVTLLFLRNPLAKYLYPEVSKELLGIEIKEEKDKAYNFIDLMVILWVPLAKKLAERKLLFLVTDENNPFVITDIPFYVFDQNFPEDLFLPLSSTIAVQFTEKLLPFENPDYCVVKVLDSNTVWEWNVNMYCVIEGALQNNVPIGTSVIASKREVLEDLQYVV